MRFMLFVLLSLAGAFSFAETDIETRFRQAAVLAAQEARARGFESIDGLSLTEIEKSAREVKIISHKNVTINFANRRCAIWHNTGQNAKISPHIYLNKTCNELSELELKGIALHEVLGLTYGIDLEYEISARLMSDTALAKQIDLRKDLPILLARGGSSTGVGGGGDYDDLKFKIYGLKKLDQIKSYAGISNEVLAKNLLAMKISAARDIEKLIEYRGPGVELEQSKTYISSSIYRENDEEALGLLAMIAASLDALQESNLLSSSFNSKIVKIHLK